MPHDPNRRKNFFFRWFNSVYEPTERVYVRVIRWMVQRSGVMVVIALALVGLAGWGLTRIPTGFIPTEDQGYVMIAVQLPDGASLERTERVMDEVTRIAPRHAGSRSTPLPSAASPRWTTTPRSPTPAWSTSCSRTGASAARARPREASTCTSPEELARIQEASALVLIPPPIQGLGVSGGFQMQVELTDGSYDFARLQEATDALVAAAKAQPAIQTAFTPFRAQVPQISVKVDRSQAETLDVPVGDVFDTLQSYLGSSLCQPVHPLRPQLHGLRAS